MIDDTLLDIDVIPLNRHGYRILNGKADWGWYEWRRFHALSKIGLTAAVASHFNPNQPRGRDGRWIEMFGWVKWLENGKWKRGQVTGIDEYGVSTVRDDQGNSRHFS